MAKKKGLDLFLSKRTKTCEGRGYWLVAADQHYWDVETVRIDCRGCADCKPKKKRPTDKEKVA